MEAIFWTLGVVLIALVTAGQAYDFWRKAHGKPGIMISKRGISLKALKNQRLFSETNFGPMNVPERLIGVIDHLKKELVEVENKPDDLSEWIDVIILAVDGAHRAGFTPQEIASEYHAKMAKNWKRNWPDWREADPTKAIEHVRGTHD